MKAIASLPANLGLYAGTMMGDQTPITNKNFSKEDLAALKETVKGQRATTARKYGEATRLAQDELARLDTPLQVRNFDGQVINLPRARTVVDAQQDFRDRLSWAHAGVLDYPSYGAGGKSVDSAGWWNALKQSFQDPQYRLATGLGMANFDTDAAGNTIVQDQYDFNGRRRVGSILEGAWNLRNVPTMALDYLGSLGAPEGHGRPVQINLGKIGLGAPKPTFPGKAKK